MVWILFPSSFFLTLTLRAETFTIFHLTIVILSLIFVLYLQLSWIFGDLRFFILFKAKAQFNVCLCAFIYSIMLLMLILRVFFLRFQRFHFILPRSPHAVINTIWMFSIHTMLIEKILIVLTIFV